VPLPAAAGLSALPSPWLFVADFSDSAAFLRDSDG